MCDTLSLGAYDVTIGGQKIILHPKSIKKSIVKKYD